VLKKIDVEQAKNNIIIEIEKRGSGAVTNQINKLIKGINDKCESFLTFEFVFELNLNKEQMNKKIETNK
jgi:hypothetical protein